ncbi:MAG TPA: hypothetical protein VGB05_08505, partial [Pyrinomonadaceae bacterium]
MKFEFRSNDDNRASRIINALTEQILTETAAFTFDHVGEGLERTLVGACHGLAATTIVEQRINRFLQHALFV